MYSDNESRDVDIIFIIYGILSNIKIPYINMSDLIYKPVIIIRILNLFFAVPTTSHRL